MVGAGPAGCGHIPLYFRVGLELIRNAISTSSERPYQGHFGAWVDVWVRCDMPVFLERCGHRMTNVWHLFEYVAYAFATKQLRRATNESHSSAITCFHRISRGFALDTTHPVWGSALKGAARSHADAGVKATVRCPVSWEMLIAGEKSIFTWQTGGRVLRLALCASFCFLTRASEMFAETRSRVHETYCLRRADVAIFPKVFNLPHCSVLLQTASRYRGSKGDVRRKGAGFDARTFWSGVARGRLWRCCRPHDRVDVLPCVSSLVGPTCRFECW